MSPAVSIIIPSYNHAHFLPDALNSVLRQTFTDWEALVIDDGSTDNTAAVASEFTDPRIKYIYQENRGLSGARNTGLRLAQGQFIALLDADDVWMPNFLERMISVLASDNTIDAAYCGFQYMDADGKPLRQLVCRVVPPDQFRKEMLTRGSWLNPCSVVVRTSVYREVGVFDESLRACEDLDMWLRISEQYRFAGVSEVLIYYRRNGNNMTDDVDRMAKARIAAWEKHLGPVIVPVEGWSREKQLAVGRIYSGRVQGYLAQGRTIEGAESLRWLLRNAPDFAYSLDLWYSLACVHQLVGQRGDVESWLPAKGEADVFNILEQLSKQDVSYLELRRLRGRAHFALALLNYRKGRFGPARYHLGAGAWSVPALCLQKSWLRLALQLLPGIMYSRPVRQKLANLFGTGV